LGSLTLQRNNVAGSPAGKQRPDQLHGYRLVALRALTPLQAVSERMCVLGPADFVNNLLSRDDAAPLRSPESWVGHEEGAALLGDLAREALRDRARVEQTRELDPLVVGLIAPPDAQHRLRGLQPLAESPFPIALLQ
jgi:hypothetical protein